jgi:hypothetical protein
MGYGATPNGKRTLFAASRMQVRPRDVDPDEGMAHTYRVATIDLAAMFRKLVPFELGADTPPFKAVQSIFMPAIHQFPDLKTIIFCFDSPHLVPEMRKTFHVERRYSKAAKPPGHNELRCPDDGRNYHKDKYPVSPADIDGLTIHSMPKWWPCFWNSAKGKFAIWEKVEESIREYAPPLPRRCTCTNNALSPPVHAQTVPPRVVGTFLPVEANGVYSTSSTAKMGDGGSTPRPSSPS